MDRERLKNLPKSPGVYLYKDELGKVIYVGKASNLNSRVRQYFQSSRNLDSKTNALVKNIDDLAYIRTGTEMEAFILESNLIKKHNPKYNILLKDDKTYPYIKVTLNENFPRIIKTRIYKKDGGVYFGPFSDTGAVNRMVAFVNQVFPTKKCTRVEFNAEFRPCLNYHIKKCKGVCQNRIAKAEYDLIIKDIMEFLNGKDRSIDIFLEEKMKKASEDMQYEEAIKYRDYLYAAKSIREKQRVVLNKNEDVDVVLFAGEGKIVVFSVVERKLVDRQIYRVDYSLANPVDATEVVLEFIRQHYGNEIQGPREILIDSTWQKIHAEENSESFENTVEKNAESFENTVEEVGAVEVKNTDQSIDLQKTDYDENIKMLEEYLRKLWGKKVNITSPQKGEMKALLSLAKADLVEQQKNIEQKIARDEDREKKLVDELKEFGEFSLRTKVEAFDISNTFGVDSVGAMVAFEGMKPLRSRYRKFKVRTKAENNIGSDDYGSTQEVVFRRLKRAIDGDKAFLPLPEIIFLDGAKGHLEVAERALETAIIIAKNREKNATEDNNEERSNNETQDILNDLRKIKLVAMGKDDKHRTKKLVYRNDKKEVVEIPLKERPFLFAYVGNIQEEVHRFAITYHKSVRGKQAIKSELENIKGIGKIKRNILLNHFGSVKKIKEASISDLEKVNGITKTDAMKIVSYFEKTSS